MEKKLLELKSYIQNFNLAFFSCFTLVVSTFQVLILDVSHLTGLFFSLSPETFFFSLHPPTQDHVCPQRREL